MTFCHWICHADQALHPGFASYSEACCIQSVANAKIQLELTNLVLLERYPLHRNYDLMLTSLDRSILRNRPLPINATELIELSIAIRSTIWLNYADLAVVNPCEGIAHAHGPPG